MNRISFITAVYISEQVPAQMLSEMLERCGRSIPKNSQWIVQFDGENIPKDLRIPKHAEVGVNGVRQGAAGTRNYGLTRATEAYVRAIDQDDQLAPGTAEEIVRVLGKEHDVGYCIGHAIDILPTGESITFKCAIPPGPIRIGLPYALWEESCVPPVPAIGLTVRREILVDVGGWTALAGSEDTALWMKISQAHKGFFLTNPTLLHHKHPQQTTARNWCASKENKAFRHNFIREYAKPLMQ